MAREAQQLKTSADMGKKCLGYSGHLIVNNHSPSTQPIIYNHRIIPRDATPRDEYFDSQPSSRSPSSSRPLSRPSLSTSMQGASRILNSSQTTMLVSPIKSSRRSSRRPLTSSFSTKSSARSGGLTSRQMDELKGLIQDQVRQFADQTSDQIGELKTELLRETKHTKDVQERLEALLEARSSLEYE